MKPEQQIEELLFKWQELRERGQNPSPEELCQDQPSLLPGLRHRIEILKRMSWLDSELSGNQGYRPGVNKYPDESKRDQNLTPGYVSLEVLKQKIADIGLIEAEELDRVEAKYWPADKPPTSHVYTKHLVDHGKLTEFQADVLLGDMSVKLVLGDYIIMDSIGAGGMGEVFKAVHRRMQRVVAIKILREDASRITPDAEEVFNREILAAGRIFHKNFVTMYDARVADGTLFLVMEYIHGQDLSRYVRRRGPLPIHEAVRHVIQAANGLNYAHESGMTHRDIKPANLMLDMQGTVKILDLGLARIMRDVGRDPDELQDPSSAETVPDVTVTATGSINGTIAFMAPEQKTKLMPTDHRADIYSLGCTLYFLLTGKPYYRSDGPSSLMVAEREQWGIDLRKARPDVPRRLENVFLRMVNPDVRKRYQSMAEVAEALQEFAGGVPVSTVSFRTRTRRKWWAKVLAVVVLVALAVLLTVVGRQVFGNLRAMSLTEQLLEEPIQSVPETVEDLQHYQTWAVPLLQQSLKDAMLRNDHEQELRLRLALLPADGAHAEFLQEELLSASPQVFSSLLRATQSEKDLFVSELWKTWKGDPSPQRKFLAGLALLNFDPQSEQWETELEKFVVSLTQQNPIELGAWQSVLHSLADRLSTPLAELIHKLPSGFSKQAVLNLAEEIGLDEPGLTFEVICHADVAALKRVLPQARNRAGVQDRLREVVQSRQEPRDVLVNASIALLWLDDPDPVWGLLKEETPDFESRLIQRAVDVEVDQQQFADYLAVSQPRARMFVLLCLGSMIEYDEVESTDKVDALAQTTENIFLEDEDPGVHAAAEWTLRRMKRRVPLSKLGPQTRQISRQWFVTPANVTMIRIQGPVSFTMGSTARPDERGSDEVPHPRTIEHTFAMSMKEVDSALFREFVKDHPSFDPESLGGDVAQSGVNWFTAAAFCRWLSEREQIPSEQMCFPPIDQIEPGMTLPDDYVQRQGYRLPTEAEWEYCCRASSEDRWCCGDDADVLVHYGWYSANSKGRPHEVGTLRPNRLGFFDMMGNVAEWCMEMYRPYGEEVAPNQETVDSAAYRVFRGGHYAESARNLRSANRDAHPPLDGTCHGIRLVRTLR